MSQEIKKYDKVSYNNEYNAQAYDRISLMVKKGDKEMIKEHAQKRGERVNTFINRAIRETMDRDNKKE